MAQNEIKVYGYRWVVLAVFMLMVAVTQVLWISFAPITSIAAKFYGVSDLLIGLLAMCYMVVYLLAAIPASWVIDTYGFRVAVGIGAILTAVFALIRGIWAGDYTIVLIAQIGMGIGQPFVLNAVTKVAARWFPLADRATASGLGTLAIYLGTIAGMFATPALAAGMGLPRMLLIYGIVTVLIALIFLIFSREAPPTPPCPPGHDERALVFDGLRQVFRQRDFLLMLVVFFVGLGLFNGAMTWIEEMIKPRGFTAAQAGTLGGVLVGGGVIGAVIMPVLSDRWRRRKPFILLALLGAIPGFAGVSFATGYPLLLISGFVMGFFLLSAGPIGFQYAAELTYPAPEGTSNGLLMVAGQVSGIIFILAMDAFRTATGAMTPTLLVSLVLLALCFCLAFGLRESEYLKKELG